MGHDELVPTKTPAKSSRTFRLTSPHMHGDDVRLLQTTLAKQFRDWGVKYPLKIDGDYGPETRDALESALYGLGIAQTTLERGVTPALRIKLRAKQLTAAERKRYDGRAAWRKRLAGRFEGSGAELAIAYARQAVGVVEHPAGENRGPRIDEWLKACGIGPAPWCGCFANGALMAAGFPAQPWLRYCPWIEQRAKAGEGGWSWHPIADAQPGDLVLYGASIAVHVGLYIGAGATIEGNTSSGDGGSQDNGGGVFLRHRDFHAAGFPARGLARPPYAKR